MSSNVVPTLSSAGSAQRFVWQHPLVAQSAAIDAILLKRLFVGRTAESISRVLRIPIPVISF
jgi:hypothetical protein